MNNSNVPVNDSRSYYDELKDFLVHAETNNIEVSNNIINALQRIKVNEICLREQIEISDDNMWNILYKNYLTNFNLLSSYKDIYFFLLLTIKGEKEDMGGHESLKLMEIDEFICLNQFREVITSQSQLINDLSSYVIKILKEFKNEELSSYHEKNIAEVKQDEDSIIAANVAIESSLLETLNLIKRIF